MANLNPGIKQFFFIILFCFSLLSLTAYSQEKQEGTIFRGSVKNSNGKLLENVIISLKYKNKPPVVFPISSEKFSIAIQDTSTFEYISFSCLGFETAKVTASDALLSINRNKSAGFKVELKQRSIELNQVIVKSSLPFYQNENADVYDYEIMPNGNLLLVMEKSLILINQQDSILKTIPNNNGINEIIKACSGRIFLRNDKLLFPTFISNSDFLLSNDPVEIDFSLKQINELIACDSIIKIKETVSSSNQKIIYKLQLISNPSIEADFYTAQDKERMKMAALEKKEIDNEYVPNKMGDISVSQQAIVWEHDHKVWHYEYYSSKKLYAPVFLRNKSIFVFDHGINKIIVIEYNKEGNVLKLNTILKDSITYNKKKGWQKIILQDNYNGDFFTVNKDKQLILSSIPLLGNAKQINVYLPKEHVFIEKIMVYNHTVYYLWKDRYKATPTRALFKAAAKE